MKVRIAIVGPCASGKTTLAKALRALGYDARQVVQEHSYVPDMWRQVTAPDLLIYLDASFETSTARKNLSWQRSEYDEEIHRLAHARQYCDFYLNTDDRTAEDVLNEVVAHLETWDSHS